MPERLHDFISKVSQVDLHREPGPQLIALVQAIFPVEAVALFDGDLEKTYLVGEWFVDLENIVRNIYVFSTKSDDPETGISRRVLRIGDLPVGALVLRGELPPEISSAIAHLLAITFDRYHSYANVSRTEAARQAEQLRATVLDSLAHAYKTPLTAIRAASTGLNEMSGLKPSQRELVSLIDEQAKVLDGLTNRLLTTAQLQAHDLVLHKDRFLVAPLIEDVIANCREQLADLAVDILSPREDLALFCDRELLVALLTQYVDNAGKYATPESTVTIKVEEEQDELIFSVHNLGSAISDADQQQIFNRYFRCESTASVTPGTGIGLSIAKQAAQSHGGDVWVTSTPQGSTTFFASLPNIVDGQ